MKTDTSTREIAVSAMAEIESMHARAVHWNSAFEFYGIELRFLKSLISKYSIWVDNNELVQDFISCENNVLTLEKKCQDVAQLLHQHGTELRILMQEPLRHDMQKSRKGQFKLETRHIEVLKELLLLRKTTFDLVEAALESHELSHIN